MNQQKMLEAGALQIQFVGDEDVLDHIVDKQEGVKVQKDSAHCALNVKMFVKKGEQVSEDEAQEILKEKDYVDVLGTDIQDPLKSGSSASGSEVYTFQTIKRSNKMAQLASELARTPGKRVTFGATQCPQENISLSRSIKKSFASNKTPSKGEKNVFVSTTPYRLRKRLTDPDLYSENESEYSASDSEEELAEELDETVEVLEPKAQTKESLTSVSNKIPAKRSKRSATSDLVENYFEAHSSSKVLTSDRTLQKLQTPKLDQETLHSVLDNVPPTFPVELKQLNQQYEDLFHKWMLQLHLGFNIVLYGLGSKRNLLEKFRTRMLQDSVHIVINGFFPNISVKSILCTIIEEVLNHMGGFHNPLDQLDFIVKAFKEDPSLELHLLIHNLDSQMLRGDKSQQILGQLASIPNIHVIASIDHINAPLMWDQAKQSLFNWLWYETTTYNPYVEETSYENSLLVKQSGALALSSLVHVLRSLTPNARGIFRLLAEYQLANKDNPSYTGLSFQDFYQQCREAFLVNSDLTLRAQLTEFRDHKLIRTKKGADGVECLLIPVDFGTLHGFFDMEDKNV
nr:origin recognition complex subunit 2 isoform X2 [Geotrypetes seraphini]XP_033801365.1 origin recognition complex subunit 2 isoform X2 [Geotrypetes seraphini]